jgi:hypothetical protein
MDPGAVAEVEADRLHHHERHVLGEDVRCNDVDQHQRVVVGQVDDDVVGRMVGAVVGEIDPVAADHERAPVRERLVVRGASRVVVAEQELARLLVPDAGDVPGKQRRRADVVGVVVRVDQVVDLVADAVRGGDLVDRAIEILRRGDTVELELVPEEPNLS